MAAMAAYALKRLFAEASAHCPATLGWPSILWTDTGHNGPPNRVPLARFSVSLMALIRLTIWFPERFIPKNNKALTVVTNLT